MSTKALPTKSFNLEILKGSSFKALKPGKKCTESVLVSALLLMDWGELFKLENLKFDEPIDRITSYNVCYTKLLRY